MPETLLGVDCFHGDQNLSFHDLAANGVAFCFLKASQGVSEVDPAYKGYYDRAKSVGLITGAYHFLTSENPVLQARQFLNAADLKTGDLVPVLDSETYFPGVGAASKTFSEEIKDQTGRYPLVYSGESFFRDNLMAYFSPGDYTLWLARYPHLPEIPCAFHQFTDHQQFPNNPPLDCSRFFGTLADLKTHCL